MNGLQRYGFHEKAVSVRKDIIELVRGNGDSSSTSTLTGAAVTVSITSAGLQP